MEAKSGRIGHAHLIAYPIVDQKDADVRHHIPVAKRVHVVEEGKITYNHEMQSVGFSQADPNVVDSAPSMPKPPVLQ